MAEGAANMRLPFATTFYFNHIPKFSKVFMKGGERRAKILLFVSYRVFNGQETMV
jgi:hypothetical protein